MARPENASAGPAIDALRALGTASRAELAQATGLSRSTVSTLVGELQQDGLLVETGGEAASSPGRPPTALALDPAAGTALGVDFGHSHVGVALADLSSRMIAERQVALDVDGAAGEALDVAAALVGDVLAEGGVGRERVIGCGMGIPGPVDRVSGTVGSSAILSDWVELNPGEELARRTGLPVVLDNDANLGALGEVAFGAGRDAREVVYVKIASGIGAGLILDGRLHHGATGLAGELGHVLVDPGGRVCRCSSRGCLETVAAAPALLELLRETHGDALAPADLVALAQAGDVAVSRLLSEAGRAVGRALAAVCNVLNPELVIVGGQLSAAGEPLLSGLRESVDRFALPKAAEAVRVVGGVLGERAGVLGAVAMVVSDTRRVPSGALPALAGTRLDFTDGSTTPPPGGEASWGSTSSSPRRSR